ncbi:MAG: hypothetical protein ACLQU1_26600 [Bryobacteraceae bacterium]
MLTASRDSYIQRLWKVAWRETRHVWTSYRWWISLSPPSTAILFDLIRKGWRSVTAADLAVNAGAGAAVAFAGTIVISLLRAPKLLDDEWIALRSSADAIAALERENQKLKEQLEVPKLVPKITECSFFKPVHGGPLPMTVMLEGASPLDLDFSGTRFVACVEIANEHRVPTTAKCALTVTDKQGSRHVASGQPVEDRATYPPLDLSAPIEFAQPRSGWVQFRVSQDPWALSPCTVTLTVVDGIGAEAGASCGVTGLATEPRAH